MSQLQTQPTLVEQVVNAIVSEIVDGELPANARLIQDELPRPMASPGSRSSRPFYCSGTGGWFARRPAEA